MYVHAWGETTKATTGTLKKTNYRARETGRRGAGYLCGSRSVLEDTEVSDDRRCSRIRSSSPECSLTESRRGCVTVEWNADDAALGVGGEWNADEDALGVGGADAKP